jgi:hypothetical protein
MPNSYAKGRPIMMTQERIVQDLERRDYQRLARNLLRNGRCHSRSAEAMLCLPGLVPSVGLGLALQRLSEIAYRPHPLATTFAHRLARMQQQDGLFGTGSAAVAATAVALRGLVDWLNEQVDGESREGDAVIRETIARAWKGLARRWTGSWRRTGTKTMTADDACWAVVLWQLGNVPHASAHLPITEIRRALARSSSVLRTDDLSRLALTMAA